MKKVEHDSVKLTVVTGDDQEAIPIENATLNNTMNAEHSTYDLRDDTVEQLIGLLNDPYYITVPGDDFMNLDRRKAVAGRLEQQKPNRRTTDAVAFCGLPGAGKSYVSEKFAEVYDTETVSMGDAIREEYKNRKWDREMIGKGKLKIPSDELGNFAAEWRAEAPEEIPAKTAEIARNCDQDVVIIDGVRSPTDAETLADEFDDFYLIEIECHFEERLRRLQDRGREGEADFDRVDLAERDMNELKNLGYADLQEGGYKDLNMKNNEHSDVDMAVMNLVNENLPFDVVEDLTPDFLKEMPC